ncbi:UNVERIFIED_CONTAM: putative mitochondrial protein [Sesamum indicum]
MQWMKGGDQCSRIFFRKIAQRRAVRRILQINDENGTTHTELSEVVQEFVSFYQNLLGGNRRRLLVDITCLKPWARHILSNEEASHLILPFSPEDVKLAIFDIAEDKAPGPDGFSSGFFKAAWPVVGTEVTRAALDFFTTGKLLKQVNTTLLALIPKIRLPPRCALKVDIRKAYDTVKWDFLAAVLQFFNFPTTFIRWIEECITTASFSIGLNEKPHGFFNGARGLRQGDPLSPYLFVLVMEILHLEFLQLIEQDMQFTYHWKCEPARVFQLGFADDLLLFCRADMDSVRVFKMGLDRFAEWSGLRLNIQKSHLILSRSAQDRREQMLAVLGFQEGHLPMRYLGLSLLSSRLSISDCQPLLSKKIDARITGWEGISLSYAGRVQIIKSVLSTLSLYWASAFILPKAVIKEVEKRLRTFLWKGTSMTGYAKVAWKDICKPVEEGGLGIKDIGVLNRALMTKKLCDVIRCDRTSIWVEWLQHGRLRNNSIWTVGEQGGSWGWRKMLRLRSSIQPMVELHIGDGRSFYLWKDPWHQLGPLLPRFPRGPNLLGLEDSTKLFSVIEGGQWHWPLIRDLECLQITYTLPQIHGGDDMIIWRFPEGHYPSTLPTFLPARTESGLDFTTFRIFEDSMPFIYLMDGYSGKATDNRQTMAHTSWWVYSL